MITATDVWKKWEGKVVDGKFPLQRWLGGSDHSAVFLTELREAPGQKAAIKLIPAEDRLSNQQSSRWRDGATISHPHLIRIFEYGRFQIDGVPFLYVVMEYAEETLAEMLPLRSLTPAEVSEMLPPAAEALAALHRAGFVHGHIQPSNIMAAGNQLKLSDDGLVKTGERGRAQVASAYDAPEVATAGFSPASDMWSLGMTMTAVLTQNEPAAAVNDQRQVIVPETIPQPLREIVRECLQLDPAKRCTVTEILKRYQTQPAEPRHASPQVVGRASSSARSSLVLTPATHSRKWITLGIIAALIASALIVAAWIATSLMRHESGPATTATTTPEANKVPSTQPSAPQGLSRGSVLQQVLPDVSRGALGTITGRVKVGVQVTVDTAGNVSEAKLVNSGPSQYFAARALAAARRWKFTPPQLDGHPQGSQWQLRFQFGRGSVQAFPTELKP